MRIFYVLSVSNGIKGRGLARKSFRFLTDLQEPTPKGTEVSLPKVVEIARADTVRFIVDDVESHVHAPSYKPHIKAGDCFLFLLASGGKLYWVVKDFHAFSKQLKKNGWEFFLY